LHAGGKDKTIFQKMSAEKEGAKRTRGERSRCLWDLERGGSLGKNKADEKGLVPERDAETWKRSGNPVLGKRRKRKKRSRG